MNTTDYQAQATNFLARNALKLRVTLSNAKVAPWLLASNQDRNHYRVTISLVHPRTGWNDGRKVPSRLTFDFWGSILGARTGKSPTAYDVLAGISSNANCPETFGDFCAEYGYDQDSIRALQIFRRASSFAKRLRSFFTAKELEELAEIQ